MAPETPTAGPGGFFAARPDLLEWLHARSNAGRWGVSREEFAAVLARSAAHRFAGMTPAPGDQERYLQSLHLEELGLACALEKGSESAWEEFVTRYRPALRAAARAIAGPAGEACARELADSLWAELYGVDARGGPRRRPLLAYFHGRSRLTTWLRAVLAQRYVDTLRETRRLDPFEDEPGAGKVILCGPAREGAAGDPDRERLLPRLRESLAEALRTLDSADRLLLSLYYVEEMTLAQMARLRAVHEATVSRQLERIRRDVRERVVRSLAAGAAARDGQPARRGLSPAEIEMCLAYATEDGSFDLDRTLAEGGP